MSNALRTHAHARRIVRELIVIPICPSATCPLHRGEGWSGLGRWGGTTMIFRLRPHKTDGEDLSSCGADPPYPIRFPDDRIVT